MSVHCSNKIQNSASQEEYEKFRQSKIKIPDSKVHGPTWCPSGADRTRVVPMLAPWTLLSGMSFQQYSDSHHRDKSASLLTFLNTGNPYIYGNILVLRLRPSSPVYPMIQTGQYIMLKIKKAMGNNTRESLSVQKDPWHPSLYVVQWTLFSASQTSSSIGMTTLNCKNINRLG